jgi:hypothetical protein
MALRISDLAREGGVGVETVRFYQRKGLLDAPAGEALGGRHYDADDIRRLRYIRQAQTAGFTLAAASTSSSTSTWMSISLASSSAHELMSPADRNWPSQKIAPPVVMQSVSHFSTISVSHCV